LSRVGSDFKCEQAAEAQANACHPYLDHLHLVVEPCEHQRGLAVVDGLVQRGPTRQQMLHDRHVPLDCRPRQCREPQVVHHVRVHAAFQHHHGFHAPQMAATGRFHQRREPVLVLTVAVGILHRNQARNLAHLAFLGRFHQRCPPFLVGDVGFVRRELAQPPLVLRRARRVCRHECCDNDDHDNIQPKPGDTPTDHA